MGLALSRAKARAALMQELEHAVRKSSALGVIFGQTVANRVGVSSSDLECLDFLNIEGRVTAGRLAELTGLTSGAITSCVGAADENIHLSVEFTGRNIGCAIGTLPPVFQEIPPPPKLA